MKKIFCLESKRYCLNFGSNRVQQASHKNFQLLLTNENRKKKFLEEK